MHVSRELLEESILVLNEWANAVKQQNVAHVWSFLPVKLKEAMPGKTITYREEDDKAFLERFFAYRSGSEPFFDPLRREWLKAGYAHSNAATFRKRTFMMSWNACSWEDSEHLTLAEDYYEIVRKNVLSKAKEIMRVPALPLAVWFYKRPGAEWPGRPGLRDGLPADPDELLALFRSDFSFDEDPGWQVIFDPDVELTHYGGTAMDELGRDEVSAIAERLTISASDPATMPAVSGEATDPAGFVAAVEAEAGAKGLRLPPELIVRIVAALATSNVRLMGAPGTGKSTLAEIILQARKGDDWDYTLATNQWTGEDVIGGPMPDPVDPRHLVFEPGLVLAAAEADRWLGIDEINRADIDSAFGELFSLLSGFDTTLPYRPQAGSSKRVTIYARRPKGKLGEGEYGIPDGWRMIATMNSWDKASLARVSFAFSRRWCTIYVPVPDATTYEQILESLLSSHGVDNVAIKEALRSVFAEDRETEPRSLRSLSLGLGPGIAASCVRDLASSVALGIDSSAALIAALEGFVLPQFEGQLEAHDEISAALGVAAQHAGANEKQLQALDERLAIFTGRRASGVF